MMVASAILVLLAPPAQVLATAASGGSLRMMKNKSASPTPSPTVSPTFMPTDIPTPGPTVYPTGSPTVSPTFNPTDAPTDSPTVSPTDAPTISASPTANPTESPTESAKPSASPTISLAPSVSPAPSPEPTISHSPTVTKLSVIGGASDEPLGACIGPCDTYIDCAHGLECYERDESEVTVLGCDGDATAFGGTNFCRFPVAGEFGYISDEKDRFFYLSPCMGDCDSYRDCHFGLECATPVDGTLSGCSGKAYQEGGSYKDYCHVPVKGVLSYVSNNRDRVRFLAECQGDCDSYHDCRGGLECHTPAGDTVPGCEGTASGTNGGSMDFCRSPIEGHLAYISNDGDREKRLGHCQGDCDSYEDCEYGLECYTPVDYTVPGCKGTTFETNGDNRDYCREPIEGVLAFISDEGDRVPNGELGLCEGDCDDDSDCIESLRCFKRDEYEKVPGCDSFGEEGIDYCYNPEG